MSNFGQVNKKSTTEVGAKQVIWDTKSVDEMISKMDRGFKFKETPFFNRDPQWRKADINFTYTKEEKAEIRKCKNDIIYFANEYCYLLQDAGWRPITLRDYQIEILNNFVNPDHKNEILLSSRQVGKTVTTCIYLIWFITFHTDRNAVFLANKNKTVKEIVKKAQQIFRRLPFYMKPGVENKNQSALILDNGSNLQSQATTANASIGDSTHLLYIDEFAYINQNFAKEFWESVYPTLSSFKNSKVILTSTPNGKNLFYSIYKAAKEKLNSFNHYRVDWWQVPGHDEQWRLDQIADLGSEQAFNQQFGCQFLHSSSLLLNGTRLAMLDKNKQDFIHHDIPYFSDLEINHDKLIWKYDFDLNDINKYRYIFSVDIGEGKNEDYTIINIFKISPKVNIKKLKYKIDFNEIHDFFKLEQVGLFRSNEANSEITSKLLYGLMINIFNPEHIKVVLEYNTYGAEMELRLFTLYADNNQMDEAYFIKYLHSQSAKTKKIGLRLNSKTKPLYCDNFEIHIEKDEIDITERETVEEASGFGKNKKGNYEGQLGNDDIIMSTINASTVFKTEDYKHLVEEYIDYLDENLKEEIKNHFNKEAPDLTGDLYDFVSSQEAPEELLFMNNIDFVNSEFKRKEREDLFKKLKLNKKNLDVLTEGLPPTDDWVDDLF